MRNDGREGEKREWDERGGQGFKVVGEGGEGGERLEGERRVKGKRNKGWEV